MRVKFVKFWLRRGTGDPDGNRGELVRFDIGNRGDGFRDGPTLGPPKRTKGGAPGLWC
jgi:hypothetical protein